MCLQFIGNIKMQILNLTFEEPLILTINNEKVEVFAFKTQEHGNIKFGIEAPRCISVHREEIYNAIKKKQA